jgi:hypothetical protein
MSRLLERTAENHVLHILTKLGFAHTKPPRRVERAHQQ